MLKNIPTSLLCILITASCIDTHAMKRAVQVDEPLSILSLPSETLTIIAAMYKRRNTLKQVCTAFHAVAQFCNWKALVGSGHIYLSPRDQERIGAIMLDEDNVPLMQAMLHHYPAYANQVPSFTVGKALYFARSDAMKRLLEKHGACMKSEEESEGTFSMEIPGIDQGRLVKDESIAYYIGDCLTECAHLSGFNVPQLHDFFRAISKGDIVTFEKVSQTHEFKTLYNTHPQKHADLIDEGLCLAATFGHYDIVKLLLQQRPIDGNVSLPNMILDLALGKKDIWDPRCKDSKQVYMPHEEVAQLIISDNRIESLNEYLKDVIASGSPALVQRMLERPATVVTLENLQFAIELGNKEISMMLTADLVERKHPTTNNEDELSESDSGSDESGSASQA
jgi:hypothetical protein